ncbi:MAG TPA: trypsin-like peptidase domain-containing protein [Schlesneria sp.]
MSCQRPIAERLTRPAARLLVLMAFVVGSGRGGYAQDPATALESTLVKLIEQAEPSVVSIAKITPPPQEGRIIGLNPLIDQRLFQDTAPADPEHPDFQPNSFGAGIIIAGTRSTDRVILTNYHVVEGGPIFPALTADDQSSLFVRFGDRRSCAASIVAADPRSDLAILHLDLDASRIDAADLKPLDFSTTSPIRKGQFVVMLGNPYAIAHDGSASVSWGMVSNLARRPLPWTDDRTSKSMMYRLGNLIQIDGRLNLGTSGGPLLNLKGELVGLTTSLAAIEGYEKSTGFAIPMDDLTRRIVKDLIAGHEIEYGVLGVQPATVTAGQFRALETGLKQASAARVNDLTTDSPAQRARITRGDIILSVNETPIYSEIDLMRIVGLYPPESEVNVAVWRHGRGRFVVPVILGKWPVLNDEGIIETTPRYASWRGISVDYPTGRDKYHRAGDPFRRAVVVTKVAADSAGQAAELQPGVFVSEVNRIPVQTPGAFAEATKSLRGPVELRLYDGGKIIIGDETPATERGGPK